MTDTTKRVRVHHLLEAKQRGEKLTMLTAYDAPTARIFDAAGIDVLLVGDSIGNTMLGHDTTIPVTVDELIPAVLFDTVLENCLENARQKKQREPEIQINVDYHSGPEPTLAITDSGSVITASAKADLFRVPIVDSPSGGLGIGLFQAAKQAEQEGYVLRVAGNETGMVRLVLERDGAPT